MAALPPLSSSSRTLGSRSLRAVHHAGGQRERRLLAEHLLHERVIGAELLAQLGEAELHPGDLQLRVDGGGAEQLGLEGRQPRVGVLTQALAVVLGQLVRGAHQAAGDVEELSAEALALLHVVQLLAHALELLERLGDLVPGRAVLLLELGVGVHLAAQLLLGGDLRGEELLVQQRLLAALEGLEGVLHAELHVVGDALLLVAALLELVDHAADLGQRHEHLGHDDVALELELRDGEPARGAARVAGDEGELALLGAALGPGEVVLRLDGLAVLVDAHEGDVQIVAGELEVVRVAAEEGDGVLGGEHQAHVLEAAVLVEVVLAALVERHHVAAHLVTGGALLLDLGHLGLEGVRVLLAGEALGGLVEAVGDVGDVGELVDLHGRALDLLGGGLRVEAVGDEVLLRRWRAARCSGGRSGDWSSPGRWGRRSWPSSRRRAGRTTGAPCRATAAWARSRTSPSPGRRGSCCTSTCPRRRARGARRAGPQRRPDAS